MPAKNKFKRSFAFVAKPDCFSGMGRILVNRVALAGVLVLLGGCAKEALGPAMGPPTVKVDQPVNKRVTEFSEFTGRLEPVEMVQVRPRVTGYIDSIHFEEGQRVEKGQLLYVIDPRPFEARVNQRRAQVSQAEAELSLAEANLHRAERLIDSDAISEEELDIRRSQQLQAQADLEAAEAALESARLELSFTEVKAPIEGIADRYLVTEGNLVTGDAQNATLLTTIVPHDPIYAVFEVDERSFLRNLRSYFNGEFPGRREAGAIPVYLGLDDEEGFPREGTINFASNQLDPGTATLTVRAVFENEDEFLTPGLFARLRVPQSQEKDGVLIPQEAIGARQSIRYVWVVNDDNTAEQRQVKLGPIIDGMRLVREGLTGDETIVVSGVQFVQPGAPVKPEPAGKSGEAGSPVEGGGA